MTADDRRTGGGLPNRSARDPPHLQSFGYRELACEAAEAGHTFSRKGSDGMELFQGPSNVPGTQFPGTGYFRTPIGPMVRTCDAQGSQVEMFVPFLPHFARKSTSGIGHTVALIHEFSCHPKSSIVKFMRLWSPSITWFLLQELATLPMAGLRAYLYGGCSYKNFRCGRHSLTLKFWGRCALGSAWSIGPRD